MNKPLSLSQSSLQAFVDCPRLFQLKYLENVSWPASQVGPFLAFEQKIQLGIDFHRLSQQYFSGIDPDLLKSSIQGEELTQLFERFLLFADDLEFSKHWSEFVLAMPFQDQRLVIKIDLLIKNSQGRFQIYDWKTSHHKPDRSALSNRIQTILYPYLFLKASKNLFPDKIISPQAVEMIYWYGFHPEPLEVYQYSEEARKHSETVLLELIEQIKDFSRQESIFPLTNDRRRCQICPYRSLCKRGKEAGTLELAPFLEDEIEIKIVEDIDQIMEIEF